MNFEQGNAGSMRVVPNILTLALELRQTILRHLFHGNAIHAILKDVRFSKNNEQYWAKPPHSKHGTFCKIETETPEILLVNKQLLREGFEIFYEQSALFLDASCMTCTWVGFWSKECLQEFISEACLRNVRKVEFDTIDYYPVKEMRQLLPNLNVVRLPRPSCKTTGDVTLWRSLSDPQLLQKVLNWPSMRDIRELSEECHEQKVLGNVAIRVQGPRAYTYHENMFLEFDFSARELLDRCNRIEWYDEWQGWQ